MTLGQLFLVLVGAQVSVLGHDYFRRRCERRRQLHIFAEISRGDQVVIDFKTMDPVSGMMLVAAGYLATQFDIIQSHRVALKVVRRLKLADNPFAKQEWRQATGGRGNIEDWLADLLMRQAGRRPRRETALSSTSVNQSGSAVRGINADKHFAKLISRLIWSCAHEPARDQAGWFDEQLKTLRTNLEAAQAKLSAYQREHGFSATDERLDVENARLNELSAQLVAAQAAVPTRSLASTS
jgi:uncharacterized protein involved in exopolysaccharide biosynthesis